MYEKKIICGMFFCQIFQLLIIKQATERCCSVA